MAPENLHDDSPKNSLREPLEDSTDTYNCKLRSLLNAVLKLPQSMFSGLKTALIWVSRPVLYIYKGATRKLLDAKSNLYKLLDTKKDKLAKIERGIIIWLVSVIAVLFAVAVFDYVSHKQETTGQKIWQLERRLEATIEEKKQIENKPKEITQLKEGFAKQSETRSSINQLPKWENPKAEVPKNNQAEELVLAKVAERPEQPKIVIPGLEEEKPFILTKIQQVLDFFRESTFLRTLALILVIAVPLLCLYILEFRPQKRLARERRLKQFIYLEDVTLSLLGGFLLKGFQKLGYEISWTGNVIGGNFTCVLERENEKALFRYIVRGVEDADLDQVFVERFASYMETKKATKGYLVTTGTVTESALALAKEKSIELAGKENLVELIPSCLLQEGLIKKLDDSKAELAKQSEIAKTEMAEKQSLSEKLRESEDMITKLNDNKTALSEEVKRKEEEYNRLLEKHTDTEHVKELHGHIEKFARLVPATANLEEQLQEQIRQLENRIRGVDGKLTDYTDLKDQLRQKDRLLEAERNQRRQLEEKLRQRNKGMEEATCLAEESKAELAQKNHELSEKEAALRNLSEQDDPGRGISSKELEELEANNQTLRQSLAEKERLIDGVNKHRKDLETELSTKKGLIATLEHQLSRFEQKAQKAKPAGMAELKEELAEKEGALAESDEKKAALDREFEAKDELVSRLQEENQQKSATNNTYTKRAVTKLQKEVLSYVGEMAEIVFPSLDLTPLAGKGVLLRLEPKGPIVTAKGIATKGIFFESQKKLDVPSSCNITVVFFDSSNPLTVKGGIIWQTQIRGSSAYNIGFKFLSLEPSQSRRINEYINNARKVISELNKQSDITTCGGI